MNETVPVGELGLGDRYKETVKGPEYCVRWAGATGRGLVHVVHSTGLARSYKPSTGLIRTFSAPRCGCGVRYENCENDCFWPSEIERAYFGI